jgi:hemolysin activation/secretion protein
VGQLVFAARAQYFTADRALTPYEQWLVGGASTLRGFSAGSFVGDRAAVGSAELRLPITSVLSGAKFGVLGFYDAGKAVNHGERLTDARWEQGVGGGIFITAPLLQINLDVAQGLHGGATKVHLGMGFSF